MPSGTLGFLNVQAISKAVFDKDFTFTIPSYFGRKNVPLREWLIIVMWVWLCWSLHFSLLVSMAPLSHEIRPITSCCPPHFGPAVPEVNSVWFKLFVYDQLKSGPPSLLLVKGTRLRWLPKIFEVRKEYSRENVLFWRNFASSLIESCNGQRWRDQIN